jgi:hypothetical protein
MVIYTCQICHFNTPNKYNYDEHLKTKKHLNKFGQLQSKNEEKNEENEENEEKKCIDNTEYNHDSLIESPQNVCQFCSKVFSRNDNLKRHVSVCKLNFKTKEILDNPRKSKKEEKKCIPPDFECHYCQKLFSNQYNLSRHEKKNVLSEKKKF